MSYRHLIGSSLAIGILAWCSTISAESPRFEALGGKAPGDATWVAAHGGRIVFGSGNRLTVGGTGRRIRVESTVMLDDPVSSGVLAGDRLFLVERPGRVILIDLAAEVSEPVLVPLGPSPRGRLSLALMGDHLLVAESDFGMRVLELVYERNHGPHGAHERPGLEIRPVGILSLGGEITAVAATLDRAYLAVAGSGVVEIDAEDARHPAVVRLIATRHEVRGAAATPTSLYLIGPSGLEVVDLLEAGGGLRSRLYDEVTGDSVYPAGRTLYVARGAGGLVGYRDRSTSTALFDVFVLNNFFSPDPVTVDPGDTVRWTNSSGFHNVFSCTVAQSGCAGIASNESFTSGLPANPLWIDVHTFVSPGSNPYVCQSHAPSMTGLITVGGGPTGPPAVPDGDAGGPMTVGKLDAAGVNLEVSWDATTCPGGIDFQIVAGFATQLPTSLGETYGLAGSACSLGGSPFAWSDVPEPSPGSFLWWVLLGHDGATTEGPWGYDSAGNERNGPGAGGASNECGLVLKDLSNDCGL